MDVALQWLVAAIRPHGQAIMIELDTMTAFAASRRLEPTLAKIDVEGAEVDVLRGMEDLLSQKIPRDIFIELHPGKMQEFAIDEAAIRDFLGERGYSLQWSSSREPEIHQHYRCQCHDRQEHHPDNATTGASEFA